MKCPLPDCDKDWPDVVTVRRFGGNVGLATTCCNRWVSAGYLRENCGINLPGVSSVWLPDGPFEEVSTVG